MKVIVDDRKLADRWQQRVQLDGKYRWTVSGVLWNNIKERCTVGGATQLREPTYVGSTSDFASFNEFVEWHMQQTGYGLGYQLDADMLRQGAKVYSPSTCVLLPAALNKFLQSSDGKRGEFPVGVAKAGNKFSARCGGKYIGLFATPAEAYAAYVTEKMRQAAAWVARLSGDPTVDSRVTEYMKNWRVHD